MIGTKWGTTEKLSRKTCVDETKQNQAAVLHNGDGRVQKDVRRDQGPQRTKALKKPLKVRGPENSRRRKET